MHLESFLTRGLGDTSYLLASSDQAVIVDPQRDIGPVLAAARAGIPVRLVTPGGVYDVLARAARTG